MVKDPTEDAYGRIQQMLSLNEDDEKVYNAKSISLSKMEKIELYQNILNLVRSKGQAHVIAQEIVVMFESILQDKREQTTGKTMKGPVFRRAED